MLAVAVFTIFMLVRSASKSASGGSSFGRLPAGDAEWHERCDAVSLNQMVEISQLWAARRREISRCVRHLSYVANHSNATNLEFGRYRRRADIEPPPMRLDL